MMKKLFSLMIMVLSLSFTHAYVQDAQLNHPKPSSTSQKIFRPTFKTLEIVTNLTAVYGLLGAIICGAEWLVSDSANKAAKDGFVESIGLLLGSYLLNYFSRAALEELAH